MHSTNFGNLILKCFLSRDINSLVRGLFAHVWSIAPSLETHHSGRTSKV